MVIPDVLEAHHGPPASQYICMHMYICMGGTRSTARREETTRKHKRGMHETQGSRVVVWFHTVPQPSLQTTA